MIRREKSHVSVAADTVATQLGFSGNDTTAADILAIAATHGLERHGSSWYGNCPSCGYYAFVLRSREGRLLWHCHACQDGMAVAAALKMDSPYIRGDHRTLQKPRHVLGQAKTEFARRLRSMGVPIDGTVVESYLHQRGLTGPYPFTLRHIADCKHAPTASRRPAMVAAVTRWPDKQPCAIHRTYLQPDGGGKINHPQARMMLGNATGGAVRLAPHGWRLGIAEGIETALSVQQTTGLPMWACLSTSGLQNVILPDEVREVVICADHDPPGLRAAHNAADRLIQLGVRVKIALPPQEGHDFNDILKGEHHV